MRKIGFNIVLFFKLKFLAVPAQNTSDPEPQSFKWNYIYLQWTNIIKVQIIANPYFIRCFEQSLVFNHLLWYFYNAQSTGSATNPHEEFKIRKTILQFCARLDYEPL